MLLAKVYESEVERKAAIEQRRQELYEWRVRGYEILLIHEAIGSGVGVLLVPHTDPEAIDRWISRGAERFTTSMKAAEVITRRLELCALRTVVPKGFEISDERLLALAHVLRAHRGQADLVMLLPGGSDVEVIPRCLNVGDRREALANRPGARDLAAMSLLAAVGQILSMRHAETHDPWATRSEPQDEYMVIARRVGNEGEDDLEEGTYHVNLRCGVPIEDRLSAVKDVFYSTYGIENLDDWQFTWLDGALQQIPDGREVGHEAESYTYEKAGEVVEWFDELRSPAYAQLELKVEDQEEQRIRNELCAVAARNERRILFEERFEDVPADEVFARLQAMPGALDLMQLRPDMAVQAWLGTVVCEVVKRTPDDGPSAR